MARGAHILHRLRANSRPKPVMENSRNLAPEPPRRHVCDARAFFGFDTIYNCQYVDFYNGGQGSMKHVSSRAAVALLGIFAGLVPARAADKILAQSTFDSDLGGWTCNQSGALSWSAAGGNPGGRAVFTDKGSPQAYMNAPSSFLSGAIDYTKLNGKAYISWQHEIIQEIDARDNYPIRSPSRGRAVRRRSRQADRRCPMSVRGVNSWRPW